MTDNEMLAKYMGFQETPGDSFNKINYRLPEEYRRFMMCSHFGYLLFDESWSWLIPVIEKLEDELLIDEEVDPNDWRDHCGIRTFSKMVGVRINGFPLHKEKTLLASAYTAVVEAVKFITEGKID